MVSQSKILGKSNLIFITLGSSVYPFTRLLSAVDDESANGSLNVNLIIQQGVTRYMWKYNSVTAFAFLSPQEIIHYYKKAYKVIIHGGLGSLYLAGKYSRVMPLIIGRNKIFTEHVDNHQIDFVNYCRNKMPSKYKNYFITDNNLTLPIQKYFKKNTLNNAIPNYIFNNSNLQIIKNLSKYF